MYTLDTAKSEWADYAAVQAQCGNLSSNELTRNMSGNIWPQSFQLAEPLWTDPDIKGGISVRELISTSKKKKKLRRGMNGRTFFHNPGKRGKSHHHQELQDRKLISPVSDHNAVSILPLLRSRAATHSDPQWGLPLVQKLLRFFLLRNSKLFELLFFKPGEDYYIALRAWPTACFLVVSFSVHQIYFLPILFQQNDVCCER